MTSKRLLLERLQKEIVASIPDPWLFPVNGAVSGFLGTGPVMLVGERPSTGRFGGQADRLLYSLLERHGLANAHMTDVIKSRGRVSDPYPEDMRPHRHVLDRELQIVQPELIITFGQKVHDLLQFYLATSGTPVRRVWHYSYARRGAAKAAEFEHQLIEACPSGPATTALRFNER